MAVERDWLILDAAAADLETNRQSIAVITGVYESARTGKPVVLG